MSAWIAQAETMECYASFASQLSEEYSAEGDMVRAARYRDDANWYRDRAAMYRDRDKAQENAA